MAVLLLIFLMNLITIFCSKYSNLCSYQLYTRIPFCLHPYPYQPLQSLAIYDSHFIRVKTYLTTALIYT